jgi:hypothetical protein
MRSKKTWIFLLLAASLGPVLAQEVWQDPYLVLTQDAQDLGVKYSKTGKTSFSVTIPEFERISHGFQLGTFSIASGGRLFY